MKKNLPCLLAVACIAVASQMISCNTTFQPIRFDEPGPHRSRTHSTYDSSRYRLDEIIVMFKSAPTTADVNKLKAKIHEAGIDPATLNIRKCNSCEAYVELWHATDIHSAINADGIRAGSVSNKDSKGVGEDQLAYYSLNFMQNIEMDSLANFQDFVYSFTPLQYDTKGKDTIRIAVLDTGIDTRRIISTNHCWTNQQEISGSKSEDDDGNCYTDDTFGWNFIDNNNDVRDLHRNLHGTLVSHYIINEFAASPANAVQIMTLKTHDKHGKGDLFSAICAIHYAKEKQVNIINASWGFYYYQEGPHPYLDHLITQELREQGILFVTAAGNKIQDIDDLAKKAYLNKHGVNFPDSLLRNLQYHNFYPACLSNKDNNVVTVTTADKQRVSPTQNYSPMYVDMGAIPDDITLNHMKFKVPFPGPIPSISGSSFATAIMTGRIGAFLPKSSYSSGINTDVLNDIEAPAVPGVDRFTKSSFLQTWRIRNGRTTPHK